MADSSSNENEAINAINQIIPKIKEYLGTLSSEGRSAEDQYFIDKMKAVFEEKASYADFNIGLLGVICEPKGPATATLDSVFDASKDEVLESKSREEADFARFKAISTLLDAMVLSQKSNPSNACAP